MSKPTGAQLKYLATLIEYNNKYRASPWSLETWIQSYCKGKWDLLRALRLIQKLRSENSEKRRTFQQRIRSRVDRQGEDTVWASDFAAFGFCPNSFYLQYRGYPSRNLYELDQGLIYHGELSESDGQANKNSKLIREKVECVQEIKWFKASKATPLYDEEFGLSGTPDGVILFENRDRAIVEIKSTRSSNLSRAFLGDVLQACAYQKLYQSSSDVGHAQMSSRIFIIYVHKESGERQLFEENCDSLEWRFKLTLRKIRNIAFQDDLYQSEKNQRRCPKCGYRELCKKLSSR